MNTSKLHRLKNSKRNEEARRELGLIVFGVENNVLLNIPGGKKKAQRGKKCMLEVEDGKDKSRRRNPARPSRRRP